jgi:DNA (cytosine-5)-methyltransferase 1
MAATIVDLFCGAGGLSAGFTAAGFRTLEGYDRFAAAVKTYRRNFGDHVAEREITERTKLPNADVFVGGPPCQGFSSAGMRRAGDSRNSLVSCFANLVCRHRPRPRAFVFENVEGFLTAENGDRVLDLLAPLVDTGYRIHLRKINAANFGVPQHRKRVIAIGGLGWDPGFPQPTHFAVGAPGAHLVFAQLPATTLREALSTLPMAAATPPGNPQGHFFRPLEGADLARAKALAPGQTMRDLPEAMWHESFKRRAFRRVMDGTPTERRGGPPAGVKRLRPDEPSKAITSGATTEFLHPFEHRMLTLRECALIQTFPNDFEFCGSVNEQTQLIGNAVPPLLAQVLAEHVAKVLESASRQSDRGELLSFVPTESDGMSPALKRASGRVLARFQRRDAPRQIALWA